MPTLSCLDGVWSTSKQAIEHLGSCWDGAFGNEFSHDSRSGYLLRKRLWKYRDGRWNFANHVTKSSLVPRGTCPSTGGSQPDSSGGLWDPFCMQPVPILSEPVFKPDPVSVSLTTQVPLIHEDHFDLSGYVTHCHVDQHTNGDGSTITLDYGLPRLCREKILAGCTDCLNTVRDAAIPPCLSLFSQRHPTCVSRHELPTLSKFQHVSASMPSRDSLSILCRSAMSSHRSVSKHIQVLWYTGYCHHGDGVKAFPAPQRRTTTSGAVPVSTSTSNEILALQDILQIGACKHLPGCQLTFGVQSMPTVFKLFSR